MSADEVFGTYSLLPGAVAPEAAGVTVPVLIAQGERDVLGDPKGEMRAYQSASSIDWFRCLEWATCTTSLARGSCFGSAFTTGPNGCVPKNWSALLAKDPFTKRSLASSGVVSRPRGRP